MISIVLGGSKTDADFTRWAGEDTRKLARFFLASDNLCTFSRAVSRSTQKLSFIAHDGASRETKLANDPMVILFDDRLLERYWEEGELERSIARLGAFLEPALDGGLNVEVLLLNEHPALIPWLLSCWPSKWPQPRTLVA